MKKYFFIIGVFLLSLSCEKQELATNPAIVVDDLSKIQADEDTVYWTMIVNYPYSISENNIGYTYSSLGAEVYWHIGVSHNGIAVGWGYQGKLKYLTFSVDYSFPSGVSQFESNPTLSITSNESYEEVEHIYYEGGWRNYEYIDLWDLRSPNEDTDGFFVSPELLYVTRNPNQQWVGGEYHFDFADAKINYSAAGTLEKSKNGMDGGTFYIDSGVTGLNINDVDFDLSYTANPGYGVILSSKWINGTFIYFTLSKFEAPDGSDL